MNELFAPATPERVGIPSSAILDFVERIENDGIPMHGFLVLRRGAIATEGYWAPFTADRLHRMYSISKSFVALAVGLMVDEGKLRLDDRVASFFPDLVPENLHPYLAETTVRDLLMMASPHSHTSYTHRDRHFAATFFHKSLRIRREPCFPTTPLPRSS